MANSIHDNLVRPVQKGEIEYIAEWALPFFVSRHPRICMGSLYPLLNEALKNDDCHLVRTDNVVGLFVVENSPWEPLPTVCDVFVASKKDASPFEVCRIYNAGLEWARDKKAIEYRYGTDGLSNLNGVAQRIGYDIVATNYVKRL
jgi:hypothetical protein